MNILLAGNILLQITINYAYNKGLVSDDEILDTDGVRRQDTVDFDSHRSNRRFSESNDGVENKYLENIHQEQNGKCRQESFVDKYKTKAKDAGAIEFVSADALLVNEEEILAPCVNNTKDDKAIKGNTTNLSPKTDFASKIEVNSNRSSKNHEGITPNTATTADAKTDLPFDDAPNNAKSEKIRRSEYQFSSVEYYDDTIDFDETKCPDAVEVIILQLDEIRKYDVECEAIIEWRSLE